MTDHFEQPQPLHGGKARRRLASNRLRCVWAALPVLVALSGGCSIDPATPLISNVSYPLKACGADNRQLALARESLSAERAPVFDDHWVCVTRLPPNQQTDSAELNEHQTAVRSAHVAKVPTDVDLRREVEQPFMLSSDDRRGFGIALAGGGSKAGAFGIGVMAGLADLDLLDSADYLSSVSGGSYAAYFYFSHRVLPLIRASDRGAAPPTTADLFRDCIGPLSPAEVEVNGSSDVADTIRKAGACPTANLLSTAPAGTAKLDNTKYQAFLKCQQDIFQPGKCTIDSRSDSMFASVSTLAVAESIVTIPLNLVANILFDWGAKTSPSAATYRSGIGLAYGTTIGDQPMSSNDFPGWIDMNCDASQAPSFVHDCRRTVLGIRPVAMSFDELRKGYLKTRSSAEAHLPFWIINATAQRYRSAVGWLSLGAPEAGNDDLFEMTAVSHGGEKWGYVSAPMSLEGFSVLDAVAASGAFADSSQLAHSKRLERANLGFLLRFANFEWGFNIPNYNVGLWRRGLHRALPFPLYWLDSSIDRSIGPASKDTENVPRQHTAYINLTDGGNGEDLGAFALVKRKVRTMVVADSSSDSIGGFDDLCAFEKRMKDPDTGRPELYIPGLADFANHCERQMEGYDLRHWAFEQPALMGCLRQGPPNDPRNPCSGLRTEDIAMVIIKPAIDLGSLRHSMVFDGQVPRRIRKCFVRSVPTQDLGTLLPAKSMGPPGLLNCDSAELLLRRWLPIGGGCPTFPQDGTVAMTLNSSIELFVAYRELARQYVVGAASILHQLKSDASSMSEFEKAASAQGESPLMPIKDAEKHLDCTVRNSDSS